MRTGPDRGNLVVSAALCALLILSSVTSAYAGGHGGRGGDARGRGPGVHRGHKEVVVVGRDRYHYRDGFFFRPCWFGFECAVSKPPLGAVITVLPFGHHVRVVAGVTYYHYGNVYYRECPGGYTVVDEPVVVTAPVVVVPPVVVKAPQSVPATVVSGSAQTITVNIPNRSGSFTPVTLVRQGEGYVGPQGEYYAGNPTVEQLKVLYGS